MKSLFYSSFISLLLLTTNVYAIEFETIIEDFKFNSTSRVIIDEKTIEETRAKDVFSLLSTQANLSYSTQNLQAPQIYLRGGDASHILIVIDGVPTYDASTNQRTFNLNNLNIKNIRKIEILKGGQAVVYGGQALSGVILIETKSSYIIDDTKSSVELGLGSQNEKRIGAQSQIPLNDQFQITPSARYINKNTQSPVKDSSVNYKDATENYDIGLTYKPNETNQFFAKSFYFKDRADLPTTANINGQQAVVDGAGLEKIDELYGFALFYKNTDLFFKPRLALNTQNTLRSFFQDPDDINDSGIHESQKANVFMSRLDVTPYKGTNLTLESGVSYTKEKFTARNHIPPSSPFQSSGNADASSELRGLFLKINYTFIPEIKLDLGVRADSTDRLKTKNNFHAGLVLLDNTRLEWSTGYRAPSLGQRYGRFPNPDLQVETSSTYSISQDYYWQENLFSSLTLFDTHFDNLISTGRRGTEIISINIAKSQTRGLELATSYNHDQHTVQVTYGYQEPWDIKGAKRLLRRPMVSGSARYFHRHQAWSHMLEGSGTGERFDEVLGVRQKLSGFFLANASTSYQWSENIFTSLRLNNMLNFRPQLSTGYYAEGFNALASLEITL